jgi:PAS domain S-box-containing protein
MTEALMTEALRVLLVEDSAEDAELLMRELRRGGYEPTARRVDTEEELLAAMEAESWDVAIIDWTLPVFSAHRAIAMLRSDAFEGPIIIVSGVMGEELVVEAMRSGADDYVVKANLSRLSPAIEREVAIRTATRRVEGRLAVSEGRLRSLLDTIPASTYVAGASGSKTGRTTEYVSPQITHMIGFTPEELVNQPELWYDIMHPDDRESALSADAQHFASGAPLRQEYRVVARDGRVVWVRDEAAMLPGEKGRAGFSHGILTDITESKAAEETLRRQALIFENVHDAVVIVDLEGRILDFNPGAETMFGYSKEEARGREPDFLSGVELTGTILSTVAREGRWSGEVPVPRGDGASRVAELILVPLQDSAGQMLGMVGVLRDVTERKRSEEELRRNVDLLRASDGERRQLVSRLVAAKEEEAQRIAGELHDDPIQKLSAVTLRLGMLRKAVDDEKRSEIIANIQKTVDEVMSRLRRMLFELSPRTLEAGGLGEALREYVQHANQEDATLYHLQSELSTDLPEQTRTIAYRIILEALSNVRKHAAADHATISLTDKDGGILCSVADDGKGIAPEDLGGSLPGHMGIASMRQRVEMAGGWIKTNSLPGGGTTVEFWLPGD